ncbi:ADP-ribosyltransferase domain-containing protein [Myxococcus sp. K15C18031901]|uniref:ADP-ribosyltransferase domain-containing protein n=1 Tax=Myxococcus dinghuensis TaxID=2906761 RepID=UPI0020A73CA3|nr:ADP-ribosyltransferase domain-containing protein [Myxococcus dinghuensis]MCP3098803.1 ADP-ribosyltransferase domain-containing protein [Myxococcus dinghuensis]
MFRVKSGTSSPSTVTTSSTRTGDTTLPPPPPPPPPRVGASGPVKPVDAFVSGTTPRPLGPPPPPPPRPTVGGVGTPVVRPTGVSAPTVTKGKPVLRDDAVIAPFVAKGVPRGAIKSISDAGFTALQGLEKDRGDAASPHYATLKAEVGPKADLIRAVFAQGGPHAKSGDAQRVKLAAVLNEGYRADATTVASYRKQMSVLTDGRFEPYVKMAHEHLAENTKDYPKAAESAERIRGLGDEDKVAVYKYTQEKFKPYNRSVLYPLGDTRGDGPVTRDLNTHLDGIAVTRSALSQLPVFDGTVYRGDKKKNYNDYVEGAVITRDSFTSTAKKPESKFDGDAILEIKTKTGRDIQGASLKPGEEEVLIPPGATFRVVERDDRGPILRLKLEEI